MSANPLDNVQIERFKQLAWPLMPVVLRTAQCLVHRVHLAEDLAQETMMKAMCAIDSYQDGTNMKAWLLTILRRTHIDRHRVKKNRPLELSLDAEHVDRPADRSDGEHQDPGQFDEHWDKPEELMARLEDEAVIEAMRSLPDDIRWTLLLVDVEQMEQADAAKLLDVAMGTIKSRTHRGRAMLRDRLFELASQRGWVRAKEISS